MTSIDTTLISVHLSPTLARFFVEAVGSEEHESGRFIFPDGQAFWLLEEALSYALEVMPSVIFDAD